MYNQIRFTYKIIPLDLIPTYEARSEGKTTNKNALILNNELNQIVYPEDESKNIKHKKLRGYELPNTMDYNL